jgi:hypothetical protein
MMATPRTDAPFALLLQNSLGSLGPKGMTTGIFYNIAAIVSAAAMRN